MSASHYNAAPLLSAATGNMIQGGYGSHGSEGKLVQPEPCWLVRYELAFLAFFGFFNVCECEVHLHTPASQERDRSSVSIGARTLSPSMARSPRGRLVTSSSIHSL